MSTPITSPMGLALRAMSMNGGIAPAMSPALLAASGKAAAVAPMNFPSTFALGLAAASVPKPAPKAPPAAPDVGAAAAAAAAGAARSTAMEAAAHAVPMMNHPARVVLALRKVNLPAFAMGQAFSIGAEAALTSSGKENLADAGAAAADAAGDVGTRVVLAMRNGVRVTPRAVAMGLAATAVSNFARDKLFNAAGKAK